MGKYGCQPIFRSNSIGVPKVFGIDSNVHNGDMLNPMIISLVVTIIITMVKVRQIVQVIIGQPIVTAEIMLILPHHPKAPHPQPLQHQTTTIRILLHQIRSVEVSGTMGLLVAQLVTLVPP